MSGCNVCDLINDPNSYPPKPPMSTSGKVLVGVCACTAVGICAVTASFTILPALRKVCLPYVPATTQQVSNVMRVLRGRSGSLVDLGSGDGRIVIEAAKHTFQSEGIELNPWLVFYSRYNARRNAVHSTTKFYTKDLWKHDLSKYDNIVVFGVDSMMPKLEQKLLQELGPTSQVVACRFPFENWKPTQTVGEGVDTVWLYEKPTANHSTS